MPLRFQQTKSRFQVVRGVMRWQSVDSATALSGECEQVVKRSERVQDE